MMRAADRKTSNKATDNYGNTVVTCKHYYKDKYGYLQAL